MRDPEAGFEIRKLALGSMDNNVYIVVDRATGCGVIIDASADANQIAAAAADVQVEYILITHGDHDHVDALADLWERYRVPVAIHADDAANSPVPPEIMLEDGQEIHFGASNLLVLHTPGHTPGSVCFYAPGTLFSGDTLFPGGPGNTRGNRERFAQIIGHIRDKLFSLPEETAVLPGHGAGTTIGAEKPALDAWIARGW